MPDKTLTVATYAAGASLAAITLIYVFGPTYLLDGNPSGSTSGLSGLSSNRKKGVVGLANPANDCFINSVLQALAGLGDLRLYLIREIHRRSLDDASVYMHAIPPEARGPKGGRFNQMDDWKMEGLQSGIVTKGLKDMLDALNERPIYKKTITAGPFVRSLETAFRQRISRQQQDAQEFLQVVAERLCDEYHAGRKARRYVTQNATPLPDIGTAGEPTENNLVEGQLDAPALDHRQHTPASELGAPAGHAGLPLAEAEAQDHRAGHKKGLDKDEDEDEEQGFPLEGKLESQIECLTCKFRPRPTESTFCTLTLNVPQVSSTTLNACFDGLFKTELIDDFKCEKCRLVHAKEVLEVELQKSTSDGFRSATLAAIDKLKVSIATDPEKPPEGVALPDMRYAPKRRIARHIRLTRFPKILAIHLSRSIYDSHTSQKNPAKVAFPERLPLGGLLQQKKYKLLGVVTHKGSHHSGHYESFRRQNVYPPFSNPSTFQPSGAYIVSGSPASTPRTNAIQEGPGESSPLGSTPDLLSTTGDNTPPSPGDPQTPEVVPAPSIPSSKLCHSPASFPSRRLGPTSSPRDKDGETNSIRSVAMSARSTLSRITSRPSSRAGSRGGAADPLQQAPSGLAVSSHDPAVTAETPIAPTILNIARSASSASKPKRRKERNDQWWRISDEKVKEASTRDVLGMQREVYLLFYEMERSAS